MRPCKLCGEPLRQLSSVAADPHDEPVLYCPCWPTDWGSVLLQVTVISLIVGAFVLIGRCG